MGSKRLGALSGALAITAMGFLGTVHQAQAHHAFSAEFDANAPVLLRGPITKVEWINPHSWIHISVTGEDGTVVPWMIEGGTPNTLLRRGLRRNMVKPGTDIVVRGYQAKDKSCKPACKANGRDVTFPDGRKIFIGSSGTGAPTDGAEQFQELGPDDPGKPFQQQVPVNPFQ